MEENTAGVVEDQRRPALIAEDAKIRVRDTGAAACAHLLRAECHEVLAVRLAQRATAVAAQQAHARDAHDAQV